MKNENIFTTGQAADQLGINKATLWRWTNAGIIKCIIRPGYKQRLYSRQEIDNFWKRHEDYSPTAKILQKVKKQIRNQR